ncbi:DUF1707 domain-containing protein [Actinomadura sp. KC345]|uniref:DUF1707 SHOCT-like domain-containing protein n=1 Tax=Actinomadura sp. KC345 TaxID=2530371 RepID=UPI00104440DC|nr:DUF1707 domain-containing protein [Actinomadura sp. KC345]TDC48520.1 DUF1707 domain-containing protein [Actinomadura sp. KC345]
MVRQDEIRIGDAERDAVMVAMHDHFAAGRLDRGELDERMEGVLSAKTRGDLRALVRDLPAPTGVPDPEKQAPAPVPWGPGAAVMFGGPGHPAWRHHHHRHGHMARGHRHGPPFPAFPLLLALFLVLTFTAGPGAAFLAVLQVALAVWVIRAIVLAVGVRRSRT